MTIIKNPVDTITWVWAFSAGGGQDVDYTIHDNLGNSHSGSYPTDNGIRFNSITTPKVLKVYVEFTINSFRTPPAAQTVTSTFQVGAHPAGSEYMDRNITYDELGTYRASYSVSFTSKGGTPIYLEQLHKLDQNRTHVVYAPSNRDEKHSRA